MEQDLQLPPLKAMAISGEVVIVTSGLEIDSWPARARTGMARVEAFSNSNVFIQRTNFSSKASQVG